MTLKLFPASPVPTERIARINTDEYHAMLKAGILKDGDPIELLDGLLVYKDRSARGKNAMTIGELHNISVQLLAELNPQLKPLGCYMQTQGPIIIPPHSQPEPDGAIIKGGPRDYKDRLPGTNDVLAAIEVSDSSLQFDRSTKLAKYAEAGIAQYIIVNLVEMQIEIFEHPSVEGRYSQALVVKVGQDVSLRIGNDKRLGIPATSLLP